MTQDHGEKKGKEMMGKVSDAVHGAKDKAQGMMQKGKNKTQEQQGQWKDQAKEHKGQEEMDKAKKNTKDTASNAAGKLTGDA